MRFPGFICGVLVLAFFGCLSTSGGEASAGASQSAKSEETNAQETLRNYVQLQEQVHAAQLAIEQTRKENAEAAARNAEVLVQRLQAIEGALSTQRARELEAMQSSNRVMLIVAGTFAFVGVAAMLLMAFFQWRTVHGLAAISAGLPSVRLLGPGSPVGALATGDMPLRLDGHVEQANSRLIGALEQLEKRIYHLENTSRPALSEQSTEKPGNSPAHGNGNGRTAEPLSSSASDGKSIPSGQEHLKQLLASGQALLDEDKPERALASFEQALVLSPRHGEALVKKGTALERLQRLDEALACYDEAIAADSSFTIAYLHKGGLFNRLERFGEALQCYEEALRTQERREA